MHDTWKVGLMISWGKCAIGVPGIIIIRMVCDYDRRHPEQKKVDKIVSCQSHDQQRMPKHSSALLSTTESSFYLLQSLRRRYLAISEGCQVRMVIGTTERNERT